MNKIIINTNEEAIDLSNHEIIINGERYYTAAQLGKIVEYTPSYVSMHLKFSRIKPIKLGINKLYPAAVIQELVSVMKKAKNPATQNNDLSLASFVNAIGQAKTR